MIEPCPDPAREPLAAREAPAGYEVMLNVQGVRPGYKLSEVGVIPKDWDAVQAGDIGRFRGGSGFPTKYQGATSGAYPFFKVSDMNNEGNEIFMRRANNYVSEPLRKLLGATAFPSNSIVFAKVGAAVFLERKKILSQPSCLDNNMAAFVLDANRADHHFVHYNLLHIKLGDLVSTTALPSLSGGVLSTIGLPLPPLSEQRAIAAALSDVDALLAKLDQFIAKKRDLKQATMQQLLTGQTRLPGFSGEWEVKRLGELAEIVMGQSPSSSNYNAKGFGLPLIQGNADIANRKTIRRIFTTEITKRGKCGDILMSVRAPVGEISRAVFDVCLGRGVCAIRYPNDFMYHYLISQEPSWARLSKGSTFDSVNSADVRALEIRLLGGAAEQTAIATVLSDMDAELAALEARRDKTRALKQGMMQELLTGRIRLV